MSGFNTPWTRAEEAAVQNLYHQSMYYRGRFGEAVGLSFNDIAQRMTEMNQSEGWEPRNYNLRSIANHLRNNPQLRIPPQTLEPAPRSSYDVELLRRFRF